MPIFEYCCRVCGRRADVFERYEDDKGGITCPDKGCTGLMTRIPIQTGVSFSLKGGGWAKDGYQRIRRTKH